MKIQNASQWHSAYPHIPTLSHVGELLIAVIVLAAAQNFTALVVGANPDTTAPSVPTSLQMTSRSATEIDISWAASSDNVGVTGYHVYRAAALVATVVDPNYADLSLTPNTNYTYTVAAFDAAANESLPSAGLGASTLADTSAPSIPSNVHQTGQTTSSITIAWNASSDNVGVTSYDIYRNGSLVRSQPGTSYTDTSLGVYTGYAYTIAARDAANNGSNLSAQLNAFTAQDITAPTVPDMLHRTTSTVSSISLAWNASTDDVGVTGYRVYRSGSLLVTTGGTIFTDTGLSASSSYTYTVSAYDASSNASSQSAPFATTSSNDTTAPTIPANLRASSTKDTSLAIAWDASTDDVGVTGYKVYRDGALIGTSATTTYADTGLTPVTQYDYTVTAYDAANNSSVASAVFHATTAYDTTAPTIPSNLMATDVTDTTIRVIWSTSSDNVGVTGYDLYRGSALISSMTGTSYTDTGLTINALYSYRVRAHDGAGNNSLQSTALSVSTLPDRVAPSTPTNVASLTQTVQSIDLTWNASTDDAAMTSELTYSLYRDGVFVRTQSGLSYSDSGLHYNRVYHYQITATDPSGNISSLSPMLSVTTLPDTTAPMVAITSPVDGQTAKLTFTVAAVASDDLELNRVEFFVDSTRIAVVLSAPYSFSWNSYAVHNGTHVFMARAYDASGNAASQSVSISVINPPPPITGDLNGDHRINIYDLSILLSHFNKTGAGDFNNNGKVDIFDLSVLLSHFGLDNSNYQ